MQISDAFSAQGATFAAVGGALIGGLAVARIKAGRGMLPSATPVPIVTPSVMLGGYLIKNYLNSSPELLGNAEDLPTDPSALLSLVSAAACVGVGAKMGGGCTSGNGINGLAALSNASLVFVLTFMGMGALSAAYLAPARADAAESPTDFPWLVLALSATGICAQLIPVTASFVKGAFPIATTDIIADIGAGLAFASALSISGMVKPSKVVGFLDFTDTVHGWDPTLAFVMGAALCVALPGYQILGLAKGPTADKGVEKWANRPVTTRTLVGGALFGFGWGMCGMCPGPAMVNAGGLSTQAALFIATLFGARIFVPSDNSDAKKD